MTNDTLIETPPSALQRAQNLLPESTRLPAAIGVALLVGWPILNAVLPDGMPLGIVLLGAVLGSLTGMTAIGLVLVYRATRIVNFAQASLGSAAGVLSVMVFTTWGWNYFLSMFLGLVMAAVVGAGIEMVVIRRFFWAPRLILTLATIGLAQILGGVELALPSMFGKPLVTNSFTTPVGGSFTLDPIFFKGTHIMVLIVVPLVVAALAWFLRGTSAGMGIRAASENAERAMLLGVPVKRLSTIVWAIAASMSAMAVMLTAPIQPLPPTVLGGPAILLPALAAAVLGRMESLPRAFLAGIGLGILHQVVFWNTGRSSATDVVFLVVILAALLSQRDKLSRADDASMSSWVGAQETPPIPAQLRGLPEVIWTRRGLLVAVAALAIGLPALLSVSQLNLLGTVALTYAIVALSLVMLTGWSGQLSLGQFAIAGAGAVAAANVMDANLDLILALIASSVAGGVIALAVGLPALRIKGLFLGVTTLAFAIALSNYFLNTAYFGSILPSGLTRPVLLTRFDLANETTLYYFTLVVAVMTVGLARGLRAGRPGRVLVAVRDNERAAQARGVHTTRVKLMAFGASGAIAGLAGGLSMISLQGIPLGAFGSGQSFEAFSMVVIGGLTSVFGAFVGAFALRGAQYFLGGGLQLIVTGSGVLFLLLVFPGGLGQIALRIRDAFLRRVADRRGLVVPSLIADVRVEEKDEEEDRPSLEELLSGSDFGSTLLGTSTQATTSTREPATSTTITAPVAMIDLTALEGSREVERLRAEAESMRSRLDELERLLEGERR